jgi:primosomal protein N' (replication factor Y) (superfamily II helicase)
VLNADAALSLPDFRAAERTFQLLVQVAGRAGRAGRPGQVLIQTRSPDHMAIVAAARHDVQAFLQGELEARHEATYPPFAHLALVRFDGRSDPEVRAEAARLLEIGRSASSGDVEFLGPSPAPVARLQNRFRYRFLVRAKERAPLRRVLLQVLRTQMKSGVKIQVDIDPQSFF